MDTRFQEEEGIALKGGLGVHSWPWDWGSVTPQVPASHLGPVLQRGVGPTFVTVEEWGVTRHTGMSDMSEQLAGRPWIWSGLTLAICSFRTGLDCFNWWKPPRGGCEIVLQGENKERPVNQALIKCAPSYFSKQTRPAYPWRNPNGS